MYICDAYNVPKLKPLIFNYKKEAINFHDIKGLYLY